MVRIETREVSRSATAGGSPPRASTGREPAPSSKTEERRPEARLAGGRALRPYLQTVTSPNGGPVRERRSLLQRFRERMFVDPKLTRRTVSYQGNREKPGFRWMKYKEGFSADLVEALLDEVRPGSVLDPFAGVGTAPIVAAGRGLDAIGIEIMPVGVRAGRAISCAVDRLQRRAFDHAATRLLERVEAGKPAAARHFFRHVPITEHAFSKQTEAELARAREFIGAVSDRDIALLLDFACMSVLESTSYTRKDGQYLRWDHRSGRRSKSRLDKGPVLPFSVALKRRVEEMMADAGALRARYGGGSPEFVLGSSLERLPEIRTASIDMVITSPPYANRYDYTRIYALELAWLGYDRDRFSRLRQDLLTATVENRSKGRWLRENYRNPESIGIAGRLLREQGAVGEVLGILREHRDDLGNPQVIRLLEGYFLEMAVVVSELARIVRPGGVVAMVNDNVQYHGEEVPVDLILSDFAERVGFRCESIRILPRGKGNSSQQMARFGRREIRKCVYRWVRSGA